jgi:uncharacterized protein YjgD (DUF1641 family)
MEQVPISDAHNGNNGHSLQERLQEPEVAAALNRLLDKIDNIEKAVTRLESIVEQAPGMVSMAADTLDDIYRDSSAQGVQLEERARNGLDMLLRLTEPKTSAQLEMLLSRLDLLANAVEQAPGMVSMAADTLDDLFASVSANGVGIDERLRLSLQLVDRLTEPKTVEVLTKLLDNIKTVETLLDDGPGLVAMAVDTVDDVYVQALRAGIDIEAIARSSVDAAARVAELVKSEEVHALMESGMLSPKTLNVLSNAADALVTSRDTQTKVGAFGMLQALSDPDVQTALGFLITFGKKFGQNINKSNSKH